MDPTATGQAAPPPSTVVPRPRRLVRLVGMGVVALLVASGTLVIGGYYARRALIGDQLLCTVTTASLAGNPGGYGGQDHPTNPEVGDRYVGTSGCLAFETACQRRIELLGTRLDCTGVT